MNGVGMKSKKAAVVLSGCGYLDGAEIRESVLALLYLDQMGADVSIFAPDIAQHHVVDHLAKQPGQSARNVLTEAARIARSHIAPLSALNVDQFDILVLPGGFGAAKNLSDFAFKGSNATVLPELARIITAFHAAQKPIAAICIAPALLAIVLGKHKPLLTIGDDVATAETLESFGALHRNCPSEECVVDSVNRLATCSAYMREDALSHIAKGIEHTIRSVMEM